MFNGKTLQYAMVVLLSLMISLQLMILINVYSFQSALTVKTQDRFTGSQGRDLQEQINDLKQSLQPEP